MGHEPPREMRAVSVEVEGGLVDDAAALGLDLPGLLETALRREISAERARRWGEEHATAIASYNARVEREGLWCDEYRLF